MDVLDKIWELLENGGTTHGQLLHLYYLVNILQGQVRVMAIYYASLLQCIDNFALCTLHFLEKSAQKAHLHFLRSTSRLPFGQSLGRVGLTK